MGSLDDLIRFLIDEIALAGEVGEFTSRLTFPAPVLAIPYKHSHIIVEAASR